jgi:carboxymethylenebutenolidase
MSKFVTLETIAGHQLDAYLCESNSPKGCIIVLHEIFGITDFIKKMCHYWSARGYHALAPSLYDRLAKNIVVSYENYQQALDYREKLSSVKNNQGQFNWDLQLLDIDSAISYLSDAYQLPIGLIGFCWGGTLCWLSGARLKGITAIAAYYGTHIYTFKNEKPKYPLVMHCGEEDDLLTSEQVKEINILHPEVIIHNYPAGHAFCCEQWINYDAICAKTAHDRTELFFNKVIGKFQKTKSY